MNFNDKTLVTQKCQKNLFIQFEKNLHEIKKKLY